MLNVYFFVLYHDHGKQEPLCYDFVHEIVAQEFLFSIYRDAFSPGTQHCWLFWGLRPFETVFQSISGRLTEREVVVGWSECAG